MNKIILWLVFCCLLFSQASFSQQGTIRFGVVGLYPPFSSLDSLGHSYGFDIAIANSLCQELGRRCEFFVMPFANLFPALNNDQIDAAISALSITRAREKTVDFTIPYYIGTASILTLTKNQVVFTSEGLRGKKLGTLAGTIFYDHLREKFPELETIGFLSAEDAIEAMAKDRVFLVLLDTDNAKWWWLSSANQFKMLPVPEPLPESYGIAVKKGNQSLLNDLNNAISAIFANGKQQQIKKLYLEFN